MDRETISYRWSFGGDPALTKKLIDLVLCGGKTATTGLYLEQDPHGKVGEYAIIYDEVSGEDLYIIEYTKVEIVPFLEVDMEYVIKEGEGDADIASWRKSHRDFFEREYPGYFSDDSLVVCEEFRLIQNLSL